TFNVSTWTEHRVRGRVESDDGGQRHQQQHYVHRDGLGGVGRAHSAHHRGQCVRHRRHPHRTQPPHHWQLSGVIVGGGRPDGRLSRHATRCLFRNCSTVDTWHLS